MTPHYIERLLEEPKRGRFVASRLLRSSGLGKRLGFGVNLEDGNRIAFDGSAVAMTLWLDPSHGADERALLRALAGPGDLVVDGGANIGMIALAAASAVRPGGHVIAIEPHPRTFALLRGNVDANNASEVVCKNVALGEEAGELVLADLGSDEQNFVSADGDGLTVPVATLDEMLADIDGRVRVLKLDLEGFEMAALRGASRTLARTDFVMFECWQPFHERYGFTARELFALLEDAGFEVRRASEPAAPPAAAGTGLEPENLVAARDVGRLADLK